MFWNWSRRRLGEDLAREWRHVPDVPADGPLVLFESPDGAEAHASWKLLHREGFRTMWCPGPHSGSSACTLCAAGSCDLVTQADAVVTALDLKNPQCAQVAHSLNAVAATKPVVVVAPRLSAAHWAEDLPECRVVAGPISSKVLIRSLSLAGIHAASTPAAALQ